MRVVLDTNVLVSALAFPGGRGETALLKVLQGSDTLLVSRPLILELLDVLARKFDRDPEELSRVALFLADVADLIEPEVEIHILVDEPDTRLLECGVTGRADAIVTGDQELLRLEEFEGIRVLSLATYLDA